MLQFTTYSWHCSGKRELWAVVSVKQKLASYKQNVTEVKSYGMLHCNSMVLFQDCVFENRANPAKKGHRSQGAALLGNLGGVVNVQAPKPVCRSTEPSNTLPMYSLQVQRGSLQLPSPFSAAGWRTGWKCYGSRSLFPINLVLMKHQVNKEWQFWACPFLYLQKV